MRGAVIPLDLTQVIGDALPLTQTAAAMNELLGRATRAIADSQSLQDERQLLVDEQRLERSELRRSVLESAMARVEIRARRDDAAAKMS